MVVRRLDLLPTANERDPARLLAVVHENFRRIRDWSRDVADTSDETEEEVAGIDPSVTVEDEAVALGDATILNFVGAGVTATFGSGTATITIPGGGGGLSHGEVVLRSMLLG